jgi:hypothetical protein
MFGVPIEGSAKVLCDNQGVVKNASISESVLSKKHNACPMLCGANGFSFQIDLPLLH